MPVLPPARGLEVPGNLDAMIVDENVGNVILAMFERRPWTGGDLQLWQLQEKLNAYASFALDGEFREAHPELAEYPICIQLRTLHPPSAQALGLIELARQQLRFVEIELEVWNIADTDDAVSES